MEQTSETNNKLDQSFDASKDFDELSKEITLTINTPEVKEIEVDDTMCPYTHYHSDIGGDQQTCLAHKFLKLHEFKGKAEVIGLVKKKRTQLQPLQRAAVVIVRIIKYLILHDPAIYDFKFKTPSLTSIDHNATYGTSEFEIGQYFYKSPSELFTNLFPGPIKVTPPTLKELDANKNIILELSRKIYFRKEASADKIRTLLYLPAYVSVSHYVLTSHFKSMLQAEADLYGDVYTGMVYDSILKMLAAAQMKHYLKRQLIIKQTFPKIDSHKLFKYSMDDHNYYH